MKSEITSVNDLFDSVHNTGFEQGELIYRGQVNYEWKILPSLFRMEKEIATSFEAATFESLLLGYKSLYTLSNDPLEHMMLLQHHNVPTRLLDWTNEPLVALFFACYDPNKENTNKDGKLIIVPTNQFVRVKMNQRENQKYKQPFTNELAKEFIEERLNTNEIFLFEPLLKNPRMRIQDGNFMFFPWSSIDTKNPKFIVFEEYIKASNEYINEENKKLSSEDKKASMWYGHKMIPAKYKGSILNELDVKHGINADTMFANHTVSQTDNFFDSVKRQAFKKASWIRSQRNK